MSKKAKSIEIRCSNIVNDKNDRERTCSSFIMQMSSNELRVRCKKCSMLYVFTQEVPGVWKITKIPKGSVVFQECKG